MSEATRSVGRKRRRIGEPTPGPGEPFQTPGTAARIQGDAGGQINVGLAPRVIANSSKTAYLGDADVTGAPLTRASQSGKVVR